MIPPVAQKICLVIYPIKDTSIRFARSGGCQRLFRGCLVGSNDVEPGELKEPTTIG